MVQSNENGAVIITCVGYTDDADVQYDPEEDRVTNHDELLEQGKTFDERRAISKGAAEALPEHDFIEPGDRLWKDEYDDWEVGDSEKLMV